MRTMKGLKDLIIYMILIILLYILMLFSFGNSAIAATDSNKWDISVEGNNGIIATLSEEGVLDIQGSGTMDNWSSANEVPWADKTDKIKAISISSGIINIGDYAFCNTKIQNIQIPEGVITVGEFAFYNSSSLLKIEIPKSVSVINNGAFWKCNNLQVINVNSENQNYTSEHGVLFNRYMTELIIYPSQIRNDLYSIPNSVEQIAQRAFEANNYLRIIDVQKSALHTIDKKAFNDCINLENITIPRTVNTISEDSFDGCINLRSFEILNDDLVINTKWFDKSDVLEYIYVTSENTNYLTQNGVLYNKDKTKLIKYPKNGQDKEFIIPETVTSIEQGAFLNNKNIMVIDFGISGVNTIESNIFNNCTSLERVITSEKITTIKAKAFINCQKLDNIRISKTVNSIDVEAFYECTNLKYLEIDNENSTYYSDGEMLLNKDKTKIIKVFQIVDRTIDIPNTVTTIGNKAFANCGKLEYIVIPSKVTKIEDEAFANCKGLRDIEIPNTVLTIGNNILKGANITIKGTSNSMPDILKSAMEEDNRLYSNNGFTTNLCTYVSKDKFIIVEENIIEKQGRASVTVNSGKLAGLVIYIEPEKYDISKKIDGSIYATINDDGILTIEGTGEMREWEENKDISTWHNFVNIGNIKEVHIIGDITNITNNTFENCNNLVNVIIGEKVASIGDRAFKNCINLEKIYIPDSLNVIGNEAFKGNLKLMNIDISNQSEKYTVNDGILFSKDMTELVLFPYQMLRYEENKIEYIIPSTVKKIRNNAFCIEDIGTIIYIPDSVKEIEERAFYGQNTRITIYCKEGSKAEEYAKNIGINCYIADKEITILAEIDDNTEEVVKAKSHKVKLIVFKKDVPFNKEKFKYVWTQDNKKQPEEEQFVDTYISGQEIVKDSLNGTWYLWAMAEDVVGNKVVEVSKAIEFDNMVELSNKSPKYSFVDELDEKKISVTINTEEEIQTIDGWSLAEDKKSITKIYAKGIEDTVVIKDVLNNELEIQISTKYNKADPNNDNIIDTTDFIILLRYISVNKDTNIEVKHPDWNLESQKSISLDINEDNKIDITDITIMLRHMSASKNENIEKEHPNWIIK